ncbi:MAG: hypothetical protein A2X52_13305 [Candidatus Rokubacteria bacterium GWC2_70_16]|nr:MAG: hypothetical protein A2X52_13305 [Candidatus Rokubacteria bacterium GWC2_70_16]OGL15336.1 MAG: hypothetical protein A3K12_16015 [Candidatus Rokubacteria bacterium RIFCSPLOWO2_12_FULL_71_19]
MDRRRFVRTCILSTTAVAGSAAVGGLFDVLTFPDGHKVALARAVILADATLCSGCRVCEVACTNFNSQGRNGSSLARLILDKDYLGGDYRPRTCYQCADPPCLEACPVSALGVDRPSGTYARVIDERACIGCRKCLEACARYFQPPRPRFEAGALRVVKCHLCFGDPQCVRHCPMGALRLERSDGGLMIGYPVLREVPVT